MRLLGLLGSGRCPPQPLEVLLRRPSRPWGPRHRLVSPVLRLAKHGIDGRASRRAALLHLAAQVPAAVLAELLGLSNSAAVTWVHDAGGDWSRYAADIAQQRHHQPAR